MIPFKIKVCGITRSRDAQKAVELGVDMIGMIFFRPSPRNLTLIQARKIVTVCPPTVDRVGVFVDDDINRIIKLVKELRLDYVQLHGHEKASLITTLRKRGFKTIKAFKVNTSDDFKPLYSCKAELVMLDNSDKTMLGGTGQTFNWELNPPRPIPNLILAGGMTEENVTPGVKKFTPLVVDVNSGVESSPGIKSHMKLKRFFNRCNQIRYGR